MTDPLYRLAVDGVPCDLCGAQRLARCRTATGRTTRPHEARLRPVMDAWRDGHRAGVLDAAAHVTRDLDWRLREHGIPERAADTIAAQVAANLRGTP